MPLQIHRCKHQIKRKQKVADRLEARFFLFASAESVLMPSRTGADFFSFFFIDLQQQHISVCSVDGLPLCWLVHGLLGLIPQVLPFLTDLIFPPPNICVSNTMLHCNNLNKWRVLYKKKFDDTWPSMAGLSHLAIQFSSLTISNLALPV